MAYISPTGSNGPYVGPRPFRENERNRFFGRRREAKDLLSLVLAERVVLFYAQSGAGKSSLINTCLLPDLQQEGFTILRPIGRVAVAQSRAGAAATDARPTNIFVNTLLHSLAEPSAETATTLRLALAAHWAAGTTAPGSELTPRLLIIDQFEELWTTGGEHWDARTDFFNQLGEALITDPQLWLLLVMREDYIARLDPYAHLLPGKLRTRYYMQRMNQAAALAAIGEPAARFGRPFVPDAAAALANQLCQTASHTDRLVYQDEFIEPVQLQVVCKQIWEKLQGAPGNTITLADLTQLAGVEGMGQFITRALADYYETSITTVLITPERTVSERDLRRWFDTQAIIEGGRRNLVPHGASETGGLPNPTVHQLEQRYLLHAVERGGSGVWIELAHDRLVEPILQANRRWFAQHPLIQAAESWAAAGRDPARLYTAQQVTQAKPDFVAHQGVYGDLEEEFLAASVAHDALLHQAEEARESARQRAQELQLAQQRAADQARTALLLRNRAIALAALALLALIAAGWALYARNQANIQQSLALAAKSTAEVSQRQAEAQATIALSAKQTAEAAKAEIAGVNHALQAKGLITAAQLAARETPQRALLLVLQALAIHRNLDEPPLVTAEQTLRDLLGKISGELFERHQAAVQSVAFSRDGLWLASADEAATVRLWNQADPTAKPIDLAGQQGAIYTLAFGGGGRLAGAGENGKIWRWNLANPTAAPEVLVGHEGYIGAVTFAPANQLISASGDHTIRLWDMNTLTTTAVLTVPEFVITNDLVLITGTTWLASADDDAMVRLWDLQTLTVTAKLAGHKENVRALAVSPDRKWLASGGDDNTILLWNLTSSPIISHTLTGHVDAILDLAFSPDGRWLISASADRTLRRWDMSDADYASVTLLGHEERVNAVAFQPRGNLLISAGADQTLRQWRIDAPQVEPRVLRHHSGPVRALAYTPNGQWLASAGDDTDIHLWSMKTGELRILVGHTNTVRSLVFMPNGAQLVSAGDDQSVRIWDLQTMTTTAILTGHKDAVVALAVNAAGSRIASASNGSEQRVFLWDARKGGLLHQWTADPPATFPTLAFTSDDDISAMSDDGSVYTGSVKNGALLSRSATSRASLANDNAVTAQAVSPVNDWQARVRVDYIIQLRSPLVQQNEPESGPLLLHGHTGQVNALVFSPDERWLASGGDDNTVRLWTLEIEDLIRLAYRTAGRNLQPAEREEFFKGEPPHKSCPELP